MAGNVAEINAEAEKKRRLSSIAKEIDVKKQTEFDELATARDREPAKVYAANPAYAYFLVNKELASKVQIAVLPLGTDSGVLGNIIQGAIGPGKK